jgi:DNA-binding MarR family transcriptional regulator
MNMARDLFFSQQALAALFAVTNKLQARGGDYLKDVTVRQILAVPAIIHAPEGGATINHIARRLGTTKQSAKQIVDVMEKKKYVTVAPSERDKRAVSVSVTEEGKRAFDECSARVDVFLADIFRDFTEEEIETLCGLLKKLYGFDVSGGDGHDIFAEYQEHNADIMQKYHPNYLKRRTGK